MWRKMKALSLVMAMLPWGMIGSVNACALHFGFDFSDNQALHQAESVKMVSLFREKHGEVEPLPELSPTATFQRASWWLNVLAQEMEDQVPDETLILLADISLWAQFDGSQPRKITIDIAPPDEANNVIVMTQTSLNALVSKQLSFRQAMQKGVVEIHQGDPELVVNLQKN